MEIHRAILCFVSAGRSEGQTVCASKSDPDLGCRPFRAGTAFGRQMDPPALFHRGQAASAFRIQRQKSTQSPKKNCPMDGQAVYSRHQWLL